MNRPFEVRHNWHGRILNLTIKIGPAEPSVGIMGPTIEDIQATDLDNTRVPLSEAEFEQLANDPDLWDKVECAYYGCPYSV